LKSELEPGLPSLASVVHALQANKRLGQHFLIDSKLCERIAACAGDLSGRTVFEIGPGPGGLTRALLQRGAFVHAFEQDPRCSAALAPLQDLYAPRLQIHWEDALQGDFRTFLSAEDAKPFVVANLPYNIATPLLLRWLPIVPLFERFVLMFQKEVADRLCAPPRTKSYGSLSVLTQTQAEVTAEFSLAPGAFVPPPRVHSTVVRLDPKGSALSPDRYALLEKMTKNAFSSRRKMIRNALPFLSEEEWRVLGIPSCSRAEELTVSQYLSLVGCQSHKI
jgi:16S rRNA (adenine1518-N6/adenine1519-N6)-dimethyltransferase